MNSGKKSFIDKFIDSTKYIKDETDPDYLKYNSFSLYIFLLFFATLASTVLTAIQGQFSFLPYSIVLTVITFHFSLAIRKGWLSRKALKSSIIILEVFITVSGPMLYASSGGIRGSVSIWFFLVLAFTAVMFDGFLRVFFYILQLLFYFSGVLLDYFGVIEVSGTLSDSAWYLSLFVSMTTVSFCVGVLICSHMRDYSLQQETLKKELEEISRQRERAEEMMTQYEEQKKMTEKALKTQGEFLKNMSHEIRTPLNAIIGLAEVIGRLNDVNEIHSLTGNIINASKGLSIIINDILEFSSNGDVKVSLNNNPYPSELLFNSFRNMCVPQLEAKGVGYKIERDKLPEYFNGDITRIQQILFNLLNNAIKYTEKGTVTYKVYYSYSNEELVLIISDTGIGIKEDDMKKLFGTFERIEDADRKKTDGIGLGLSLSKKIVESLGGSLSCQSSYGEGSTFIVKIPQKIAEVKELHLNKQQNTSLYDFAGKKILYIDSTQANHFALDRILINCGAYISHAFNVKEVFDYPEEKIRELNLVIVDYEFQHMDAVQFLAHLREKGLTASALCTIPAGKQEVEENAVRKGYDGIIRKPFDEEQTIKEISMVI